MALTLGLYPPKPRPCLRFGITGHRPNRLPADLTALNAALHALFAGARDIAKKIHRDHAEFFTDESPSLKVVSSLAEGADRIAAWAAMDAGFDLQAVLPFSAADYRRDFAGDESQQEFSDLLTRSSSVFEAARERPDSIADSFSYEAAGLQMLKSCDVLIAIWDGKASRGRGGSADIVDAALNLGRPVIWLDPHVPSPAKLIEHGTRLSPQEGPPSASALQSGDLETVLGNLLLGPFRLPARKSPAHDDPRKPLGWFFGEHERRLNLGWAYPLLLHIWAVRTFRWGEISLPPPGDRIDAEWQAILSALDATNAKAAARLRDIVLVRYLWADHLANYYAQLYRSSYVRNFCFAAFAVIVAVAGLLFPDAKFWLVVVEAVLIGAIVLPTRAGQKRKWHERWIDYRHLAELLRPMRILYLLGTELAFPSQSRGEAGEIESHWFGWYYRATARELGLAGIVCDQAYLAKTMELFHRTEVKGQMDYNAINETRMRRLEERLDLVGVIFFHTTAAVCVAYIALHIALAMLSMTDALSPGANDAINHVTSVLTTALPAIGAALYAIREQGEFKGVAKRSRAMVRRLSRIETALHDGPQGVAHTHAHLTALSELAAEAMIGDLAVWRSVFLGKQLNLPA